MVSAVDESVGKLVAALKVHGLYSNTIIIYSSDNGGPAEMSNNLPLRGAKFGVFEGSFRVPAFIHSALLPPAVVGTTSEKLFHVSDWWVPLYASRSQFAAFSENTSLASRPFARALCKMHGSSLGILLLGGERVFGTDSRVWN